MKIRLVSFALASLMVVSVSFADQEKRNRTIGFQSWLGPQTNENATIMQPVTGMTIDQEKHHKLSRYDVSLKAIRGKDIEIPESENPIVTLVDGKPTEVKQFKPIGDVIYLVGSLQLKPKQLGWRFYTLNVRVMEGPLQGAVVHVRDGSLQNSIRDACVAVYPIPRDYRIKLRDGQTLPIEFEIVAQFSK